MNGIKLKELREKAELTQTELAKRVGIAQNYLSQIESGFKQPNADVLKRICDELDCSADGLLGRI